MRVTDAICHIDNLAFLPGWQIRAEDATNRFEGGVKVHVTVDNPDSNREALNDDGTYTTPIPPDGARAAFLITVHDIADDDFATVDYRLLHLVLGDVFMHEAREFLRDRTTGTASFHPHRESGMRAWAQRNNSDARLDLYYGSA